MNIKALAAAARFWAQARSGSGARRTKPNKAIRVNPFHCSGLRRNPKKQSQAGYLACFHMFKAKKWPETGQNECRRPLTELERVRRPVTVTPAALPAGKQSQTKPFELNALLRMRYGENPKNKANRTKSLVSSGLRPKKAPKTAPKN